MDYLNSTIRLGLISLILGTSLLGEGIDAHGTWGKVGLITLAVLFFLAGNSIVNRGVKEEIDNRKRDEILNKHSR